MSTLSIHPIEYLKLHLHYEEVRTGLLASLRSLIKKVFESSEQAATLVAVLLTVGLVIFGLATIVESGAVIGSFCETIPRVVFTP